MRDKIHFILPLLLLCGAACAQELPDAPSRHKFLDAPNIALISTHIGLEVTDFAITHHNLANGGREVNPLAKPFCEQGTAGQIVYFAGRTAGVVGVSYFFHKTGHHKLERIFMLAASFDSSYGVTYSFAHR
jgi:hypothetical protein